VRPRTMRKSLGGMACSDFMGVSGISLGLLVGLLMVLEVWKYLDMYLPSLSSWFISITDKWIHSSQPSITFSFALC